MAVIDQLYDTHMRTIYGFFMSRTSHRATAEDLTSEVFLTTCQQLQTNAERIADPEKYLYGVMKLTWLQYLRRKYKDQVAFVENIDDFEAYVERTLDEHKEQSLAERAAPYIIQLPTRQCEVLTLRFIEGMELKDICERLGKDMNYVKTTQRRGLRSLRDLVGKGEAQ